MRKSIVFIGVIFVFALGSCCLSQSNTRSNIISKISTATPKTVVDYFLLVPSKYIGYTLAERKEMLRPGDNARPTIIDVKHDYILIPGGDSQGTLNFVVFRHAREVVVAVLDGGYDPATPTLNFLRYERGHWRDVSKEVLPERAWEDLPRDNSDELDNHITFRLPRYGTKIEVFDSGGAKEYDLVWRQGKFVLREPA